LGYRLKNARTRFSTDADRLPSSSGAHVIGRLGSGIVPSRLCRAQGAMTKISDGPFARELSGTIPHVIFEIGKDRYLQGARALAG
jgi:hypothetical protein